MANNVKLFDNNGSVLNPLRGFLSTSFYIGPEGSTRWPQQTHIFDPINDPKFHIDIYFETSSYFNIIEYAYENRLLSWCEKFDGYFLISENFTWLRA